MLIPPQLEGPANEPAYLRIYRYFKERILNGQIASNTKMPSIRSLSQHLGISRNPVETAYSHLVAEGYIVNKARSGYYSAAIEQLDTDGLARPASNGISDAPAADRLAPNDDSDDVIDFSYDSMDMDHFPHTLWKKMTLQILRTTDMNLFSYGDHKGEMRLRSLICKYLRQNRGVQCEPSQIIITSGTQQSVFILSSLLRGDYSPIGVEAAMHPGIYRIFKQQQLQPVPLALDIDGLSCEALSGLKAVYVTPSHQFPYGMILPAAKRIKLLQWASRSNGYIIEDDYDSEFLYEGRPLPALQGLDNEGRVVYLGTFSKALAPALRLSYVVLPPALLAQFEREYADYDQTASRLSQKTMELFMEQGHLERHIRRMRKVYKEKRTVLMEAVRDSFGAEASVIGSASGLHIILQLAYCRDAAGLAQAARQIGVAISPVSNYEIAGRNAFPFTDPGAAYFVAGYGGLSAKQIRLGIRRLAEARRVFRTS